MTMKLTLLSKDVSLIFLRFSANMATENKITIKINIDKIILFKS